MLHNSDFHKQTLIQLMKDKNYTSLKYMNRPTFLHGANNPIRAGGVVFYKIQDHQVYILLIRDTNTGIFEDIGGKTEADDMSINDTIIREVDEESNGQLSPIWTASKLDRIRPLYYKKNKYLLYLIELKNNEGDIDPNIFGIKENFTGIERTIHWVNYILIRDQPDLICPRLKFTNFFRSMNAIYNYFSKV